MSELHALISIPGYHDITGAGPDAEQYNIIGLRQEGEEPLCLPGYEKTADSFPRFPMTLPADQSERVRVFFKHFLVEKSHMKAWDCKRFAGFVALGTPLSVSVLELPTDTYDEENSQDSITAPGIPYEFFRGDWPMHSAIALGNGLTLGVNGAFQNMGIGGVNTLHREYGNVRKKIVSRMFSKQASDEELIAFFGATSIEEAEMNLLNQERCTVLRQESERLQMTMPTPERLYMPYEHRFTPPRIFSTIGEGEEKANLGSNIQELFMHKPIRKDVKSSLMPEILELLKKST